MSKTEIKKYYICKEKGIFLIRVRERIDDVQNGQICDLLIHSDYGDKKLYTTLDECIREVLKYFQVDIDVDVERDAVSIKEQYYSIVQDNSLGMEYPAIAKEWDYSKNGKVTPYMVSSKSGDPFHWICPKCGNSYPAAIYSRTSGHGCSKCAGVSKKEHEEFVLEMAEKRPEIEVLGEYVNANTKILFRCSRCGNEFWAAPHSILKSSANGNGCDKCSRKKSGLSRTIPKEEFLKRVNENKSMIEM